MTEPCIVVDLGEMVRCGKVIEIGRDWRAERISGVVGSIGVGSNAGVDGSYDENSDVGGGYSSALDLLHMR